MWVPAEASDAVDAALWTARCPLLPLPARPRPPPCRPRTPILQGLAALLVVGLSGLSPQETVQISPDFITSLGFQQALTPSRNNGFLNMFRLMQRKALDLCLLQGGKAGASPGHGPGAATTGAAAGEEAAGPGRPRGGGEAAPQPGDAAAEPSASEQQHMGPVAASMRRKLQDAFQPLRWGGDVQEG